MGALHGGPAWGLCMEAPHGGSAYMEAPHGGSAWRLRMGALHGGSAWGLCVEAPHGGSAWRLHTGALLTAEGTVSSGVSGA